MARDSKIEWTHHTANLWHGCAKVHAGCDHCYAEKLSNRWGRKIWGNDAPRMAIKSVWNDLTRFQKEAAAAGEMHRVFCGSMMDIFEKTMPLIDAKGTFIDGLTSSLRDKLFLNISNGQYPNLLFLLLTKRPSNINKYIPEAWKTNPPQNVMFGTSPCDQKTADTLIPQLLEVKGKHFLSIEPLLGPVNLYLDTIRTGNLMEGKIDWVIVGGESGHGARPMHPDWVRSIRDQCKEAGVPFFFKQWGEYAPVHELLCERPGIAGKTWHNFDPETSVCRIGKKAAGRALDKEIHDSFYNE